MRFAKALLPWSPDVGDLATYMCSRTIDFTPELPRDSNGNLYKRRLRERYGTRGAVPLQ